MINGCTSLCMSITIPKMVEVNKMNDQTHMIEGLISTFFFGMILGAMILGLFTYHIGRKTVLFVTTLIHIAALLG